MAGATTTVTAEFLGTENVARQMNVLGRAGAQFSSDLTSKLGKMFGAVAIGTMAFSKMEQSISKNMATAKQVSSLAIKFNVDPSAVHSMKIAADDAGVSIRSLMMASKQFGKVAGESLSNKDAANNMKQLGINAEKLAEMQAKPMKFLPEAAVALAQIADENERAAAGAFLFGRQYQQISPLLEKLGSDEQARGEFLSNNNAMTNEQIKLNKESARIQSQMSEGWDKFMAATTPVLNWAMNFASYMANALSSVLGIIANQDKIKQAKDKQQSGKALIGAESALTDITKRTDDISTKVLLAQTRQQSDEQAGITKEEREEYNKIYAAGGSEAYVSEQLAKARNYRVGTDSESWNDEITSGYKQKKGTGIQASGRATPVEYEDDGRGGYKARLKDKILPSGINVEGWKASGATDADLDERVLDPKFQKAIGGEKGAIGIGKMDQATYDEAQRKLLIGSLRTKAGQGVIDNNNFETYTDEEGKEQRRYKNPLQGMGALLLGEGQKEEEEVYAGANRSAIEARRAWARMGGMEYDAATGREYSQVEYAELMATRAKSADKMGGSGEFIESKGAALQAKKSKAARRALEKSERRINETGMSPLEKAEAGLVDTRADMEPVQEDINEKTTDFNDATERIKNNKHELFSLNEKNAAAEKKTKEALDALDELLATRNLKRTAEDTKRIKDKFGLSLKETERIAQLNGAIKGDEKKKTILMQEQEELQTKMNGLKTQENAAIDAVAKAKEAAWAKERGLAKDARDDDEAYEREMQELKYKNMKNSGKTQLDILKERYNFELKRYGEASEQKDSLDAEIAGKQKARADAAAQAVIDAQEFGDDEEKTAEAAAAAAAKAGKMTDEEVAATKQAREKKDKGRQDLEKAVYDFDQFKPQAVVSDLGKMGGGAAVQFGNNPVDEIRKSNSFLKAIEKNTSTGNIKSLKAFESPEAAKALRDLDAGLFGEDVPM